MRKSPQWGNSYEDTNIFLSLLNMVRTKKKQGMSTSGAEKRVRTRRVTTKRTCVKKDRDRKGPGMGGTAASKEDEPKKEDPSLQTYISSTPTLPSSLPDLEDYKTCPNCSSLLKPAVVPAGCTTVLLQCTRCSTPLLCGRCLYPCPYGNCDNRSCEVVTLLLTCDRVTDKSSRVYGCPLFRSCPTCHSITMHTSGCKYISCIECRHGFCFICLRNRQECEKDRRLYWSLTCSAPKAPRQRFQT